jgi:transcriptional regulator with XRE-family HTH domain
MDTRRKELGEFLQVLRQRSAPEEFGFPLGSRRRTKGLRREEVAQLAGISPTWYTWIEQGREVNVSAGALDRLAQVMKLSRPERDYLFDIAGRRDPKASHTEEDSVPEALVAMLTDIHIPAYIMGRYWDVLAWNDAASELFVGWLDSKSRPKTAPLPNLLRFVFQIPQAQRFVENWEVRARRLVAEFRADCRSRLDEPGVRQLVTELIQSSPEFAKFWQQHDVLERQGGQRTFNHPQFGLINFQQVTLKPVEQDQLKLVLLKPGAG